MLRPQSVEHLPCSLRPSGLHVRQPSLKTLDGLHPIQELLIRFAILNDDFGPSVNRQDQRIAVFLRRSRSSDVLDLVEFRLG